jgi:hypothetical protein
MVFGSRYYESTKTFARDLVSRCCSPLINSSSKPGVLLVLATRDTRHEMCA